MANRALFGWAFTGALLLAYLLAMTVFNTALPEQWSYDSTYIQELMLRGTLLEADSFAVTARLFGLLPDGVLQPVIALLGALMIVVMGGSSVSWRAGAATAVLLTPLLLMGLLRPQKEVLVALMSVAVTLGVLKARQPWVALGILAAAYLTYGLEVRPYYVLILGLFALGYALTLMPRWLVLATVTVAVVAICALPNEMYVALQGPRDNDNFYRLVGEIGNRTFFFNPFYPGGVLAFAGNYVYAATRLGLPLWWSVTPQELFLAATSVLYAGLLGGMARWGNWRARFLAALFSAHLAVLVLFEPDLGSYLRHASSVVLYLWPGVILWQRRWGPVPVRHPLLRFVRLDRFGAAE